MDLNLLIARDEQEWRCAVQIMRTALSFLARRTNLRQDECDDVLNTTVENLLRDDARVLRSIKEPHKTAPYLRGCVRFFATNHIRVRTRRERRYQQMPEDRLAKLTIPTSQGSPCRPA